MAEQPQSEPARASASTSPPTPSGPLTHDGEPYPLKNVETPHPHDVLCGRGGGTNNHIGNNHWRTLVAANKRLYISLPKRQKMLVAQSIVRAVRSQNPPGRFLQKDSSSGMWCDIGDQKAQDKTSQALREGAPDIRQEMKDEQEIVRKIAVAAAGKPMMAQQGGQQQNGVRPFSAGVPGVPPWSMPPTGMAAPVSMNGMPGPHGPGPGDIPPPPPPGPPPMGGGSPMGSPMMGFPSPHSINSPMYASAPVLLPTPAQQQQQMQMHLVMQQQQMMMQHNQGGHNHAPSPLNTRMPPSLVASPNLSSLQPTSTTGKAKENAGKKNEGGSNVDEASSDASGSSPKKLAGTTSKADAAPKKAAVVSSPGLMPLAKSEAASPPPEQLQKRDESAGGPSSTGVAPAGLRNEAGEDGTGIAPKATPSGDSAEEPIGLPKTVNDVPPKPTPVAGIGGNSVLDGIESVAPLPTPGTKRDRSRGLEQLQRHSLPPSWQQKTSATPPSALLQHQHSHPQHAVTFAPDMFSSNFFNNSPAKAAATTTESEDEAFNKLMRDQPAFEPTPFPMLNNISNGAAARKNQPSLIDSDDEDDRVGNMAPFGSASAGRQRTSLVDTDSEDENEDRNSGQQSSEWESLKAMLESQGVPTPAPAAAAPPTALRTETSYGGMSEFSIDDLSLQSMSISRNASRTNPLLRTSSGGFGGGLDLCEETNFCRDHSLAFSDMSLSRGVSLSAREDDAGVAQSLPAAQGFYGGGVGVGQGILHPPRTLTAEQQHLLGGVAPAQNLSQEQGEHRKQEPMPLAAQEANHDSIIEENGANKTALDVSGNKEERESLERLFLGRGASLAHETFGPDATQLP